MSHFKISKPMILESGHQHRSLFVLKRSHDNCCSGCLDRCSSNTFIMFSQLALFLGRSMPYRSKSIDLMCSFVKTRLRRSPIRSNHVASESSDCIFSRCFVVRSVPCCRPSLDLIKRLISASSREIALASSGVKSSKAPLLALDISFCVWIKCCRYRSCRLIKLSTIANNSSGRKGFGKYPLAPALYPSIRSFAIAFAVNRITGI